jgi:hypothetical protein
VTSWELVANPNEEFLCGIEAAWLRLLDQAAGTLDVFRSPQWFRVLRADGNSDLAVAIGRDARGAIVGLCPLERRGTDLSVYARGRQLWKTEKRLAWVLGEEPLGRFESGVLAALLREVRRAWDGCDGFGVIAHQGDSSLSAALATTAKRSWSITATPVNTLPFHVLDVPGTFEQYLAQHSAKRRYNFRRELRLLAEGVGPVALLPVKTPTEVLQADRLMADAQNAATTSADAEFCRSTRRLFGRRSQLAAAAGLYCAYVLRCGVRVVAVIWGLEFRGDFVVRALATNPQFRPLSAGSVANHQFLRALTDRPASERPRRVVYGYGAISAPHYRVNQQRVHTECRFLFGGGLVRAGERFRGLLRSALAISKRVSSGRRAHASPQPPGGVVPASASLVDTEAAQVVAGGL